MPTSTSTMTSPTPTSPSTKIQVWNSPNGTLVLTTGESTVQPVWMITLCLRGPCEHTTYELFMEIYVLPTDRCIVIRCASSQLGITPDDMLEILRTVDPSITLSANDLLAMTKPTSTSAYIAKKIKELCDN